MKKLIISLLALVIGGCAAPEPKNQSNPVSVAPYEQQPPLQYADTGTIDNVSPSLNTVLANQNIINIVNSNGETCEASYDIDKKGRDIGLNFTCPSGQKGVGYYNTFSNNQYYGAVRFDDGYITSVDSPELPESLRGLAVGRIKSASDSYAKGSASSAGGITCAGYWSPYANRDRDGDGIECEPDDRSSYSARPSSSYSGGGSVRVKGYYRKDGTYVRSHTRRRRRR